MTEQKNTIDVFMAIADPTRRSILAILTGGAVTISALAGNFNISRPAVSKHIKVLEQASLVNITESGRERYCQLNPQGFEHIKDWLGFFDSFWKTSMAKFEEVLNEHARKKKMV